MTSVDPGVRPQSPFVFSTRRWAVLAGAVLAALVVYAFSTSEVRATKGLPREQAELVASSQSAAPWHTGCGKGDDPRDFTWHSRNPPAGLPATFRQKEQCNPTLNTGDVATIVRVVGADGRIRVLVNPVLSYSDAIGLALIAAVAVLMLSALFSWTRRRWVARRGLSSS